MLLTIDQALTCIIKLRDLTARGRASISVSLYMLLTGVTFFFLGKDVEKAKEAE
jgi:hypothetical protein